MKFDRLSLFLIAQASLLSVLLYSAVRLEAMNAHVVW